MKSLYHAPARPAVLAAVCAATLAAAAPAGAVQYRFLFGNGGPAAFQANYDGQGIPKKMDLTQQPVRAELMDRINLTLPERKDVRVSGATALIADSESSTLNLLKDADIWVTFLHEGAGYRNAFGFYQYPAAGPPSDRDAVDYVVVWPNASYSTSGGNARGLKTGQQVFLGRFTAGTKIGFFLMADGFDGTNGVFERYPGWVWHSLQNLNMETDPLLRPHVIMLRDETNQQLILGFEDINRQSTGCDQDFNDVLFSIQANPYEAIATEKIGELVDPNDSDKDGVMNSDDDYPQDPLRALRVTYPSDKTRAQLAFEDLWPMEGDYDMNDLVFAYTLTEVRDAAGNIKDVEGNFQVKARGSAYSHGFGINFPKLLPADLESAALWVDGQPSVPLVSEPGQHGLTLVLLDDSKKIANSNPGSRTCYTVKFNADRNCPEVKGPTIHFRATFKNALTRETLGSAPYNPFIYITGDRLRETHLADHPPTDKYKGWLFGWGQEGSDPAIGRFYKTKGGLPWAINLPLEWQQPLEKRPVNACYPAFVSWVNSSGAEDADWYRHPVAGCVFPDPAPQ
ncbi:LruC domain-containing protein [Candidatus Thiodictyon syntrophicum]|jgi:LruC domain-containing protein|uniref:LruC domain-containing protein n=1 Tax=Candidatus Thiodictyon syntrophicum TaxID=1166950 RepID=A0A2K8U570_9GAMM|nr:LruC domain-containing protein [Candidatus Thiodictyon syntrophicum]AUB80730.1 hypothetical protein THSYN_07050 [Candidatus Thiodictyon syntrophicum]